MNFIEMCKMCKTGKATPDQVDVFVEKWHNGSVPKDTLTLREFLGMTEQEYEDWGNGTKTREELRASIIQIIQSMQTYVINSRKRSKHEENCYMKYIVISNNNGDLDTKKVESKKSAKELCIEEYNKLLNSYEDLDECYIDDWEAEDIGETQMGATIDYCMVYECVYEISVKVMAV